MTRMLLRSAQLTDLEAIHQLAVESGIGLTTLPDNIDILNKRLQLSVESFQMTREAQLSRASVSMTQ